MKQDELDELLDATPLEEIEQYVTEHSQSLALVMIAYARKRKMQGVEHKIDVQSKAYPDMKYTLVSRLEPIEK